MDDQIPFIRREILKLNFTKSSASIRRTTTNTN